MLCANPLPLPRFSSAGSAQTPTSSARLELVTHGDAYVARIQRKQYQQALEEGGEKGSQATGAFPPSAPAAGCAAQNNKPPTNPRFVSLSSAKMKPRTAVLMGEGGTPSHPIPQFPPPRPRPKHSAIAFLLRARARTHTHTPTHTLSLSLSLMSSCWPPFGPGRSSASGYPASSGNLGLPWARTAS